ncbi:MAG: hypothetical protein PHC52_14295 [Syntrophales bacterium]|nr:hypothetical protein [Syntrophales bacterium]
MQHYLAVIKGFVNRIVPAAVLVTAVWVAWSVSAVQGDADPQPAFYKEGPGPYKVKVIRYTWLDKYRNRRIPAKIYYPENAPGRLPIIIFSHGLGGSREGNKYLGSYWAEHGYISVHIQHQGSDREIWLSSIFPLRAIYSAARDPANGINRPLDIRFAIDEMERMDRKDPLFRGKLDTERIGAAGHSFGAFSVLAVAGLAIKKDGDEAMLPDRRVRAALPMSAPVPLKDGIIMNFDGIEIPCLHMTGTRDDSPIGETAAKDRRVPFDRIGKADQYLLTLRDGDHITFSHWRFRGDGSKDELHHELIKTSSLAFWDGYLKKDARAMVWLNSDFQRLLGDNGTFEKKTVRRSESRVPSSQFRVPSSGSRVTVISKNQIKKCTC